MPDPHTVFHVEDNVENRLLVKRILQAYGYNVTEAETSEKALDLLQNLHPDIILLDINMPDMAGYTLTSKIKASPALANVPVVTITANVMKGDRERTFQAGCDGYIEKPIDVDRFIDQREQFLK